MDDSLMYYKKIVEKNQFSVSRENSGKSKNQIKTPGAAMIDAVNRLIYFFEKES
ncbi:MAG: hypothetical protein ACK2TS_04710 [Anaerolineales bacterium]